MPEQADSSSFGSLSLPDGHAIEFAIRYSTRARSARLRIHVREGLVVVVPAGLRPEKVQQIVASKADWISLRLAELDRIRHLVGSPAAAHPESFNLLSVAESWRVEYRRESRSSVGARTDRLGRIVVYGEIDNVEACHGALRRWLARHATVTLRPWLGRLSEQGGPTPTDIAIKNQRTRWGSCARSGRISLNCKLLFLPRDLVRYVMIHELCHLLEPNHSNRFWAHVRRMDVAADSHHGQMRDAWKFVPHWAQRGSTLVL